MRVTCIGSTGGDTDFPLTVGAVYVVYALTTFRCYTWYYVFDDHELPYPVWKLAPLFEIAEPSLPADWIVGYVRRDAQDEGFPCISFPEWALDHHFYERLVDGDPAAVSTFEARRASAERETP